MSVLNGVRFCDKCHKSVPRDEVHLNGLCGKCWTKKRSYWRVGVIAILSICLGSIWGLTEKNQVQDTTIVRVETESVARDEQIVAATITHLEELWNAVGVLQEEIDGLGDIANSQAQQVAELKEQIDSAKTALLTDTSKSVSASVLLKADIEAVATRLSTIESDVKAMRRMDIKTIEHAILNPTIMVEVREKNNKAPTFGLGTAVIIRKEEAVVAGEVGFRYYAITDAHLFNDIWGYLENTRPQVPPEKQLDPEFWIAHYDGMNTKKPDYFVKCEVLFPDNHYVNERIWQHRASCADFAIITFFTGKSLDVAEMASDKELAEMRPNDPIFNASIFPTERPGLTTGIVSSLISNVYNGTMVAQCSVNPGSSGSPVFLVVDGKPKVVGLIQVITVTQVGGNAVLAYCSRLDAVRRYVAVANPTLKNILQ